MTTTYPTLHVEELRLRCEADMRRFTALYPMPEYDATTGILTINSLRVSLQPEGKNLMTMKATLDSMKQIMRDLLGNQVNLEREFDYAHDIKMMDASRRNLFWALRTFLFYQLLCDAVLILTDKSVYDEVYTSELKATLRSNGRPPEDLEYRPDLTREKLRSFELGIFGSITPTSDIDVGIKYKGNDSFPCLHYVVAVIEDTFTYLLGFESSLKLDIEAYADMYLITSASTGEDLFYLESSSYTETDFLTLLPYVVGCMLRNYVFAKQSTTASSLSASAILQALPETFWQEVLGSMAVPSLSDGTGIDAPRLIAQMKGVVDQAKGMVSEYLDRDYAHEKEEYYNEVSEMVSENRNSTFTPFRQLIVIVRPIAWLSAMQTLNFIRGSPFQVARQIDGSGALHAMVELLVRLMMHGKYT